MSSTILTAFYHNADVTSTVKSIGLGKPISVSNDTFGTDPASGVVKTLSVVVLYTQPSPNIAIAEVHTAAEGTTLTL